jgi:arsenate reductase
VIEVMREVHIDLSACRPTRLTVEMQLHADWAVTMSSGDACPYLPTTSDACPYVPTTVDARDIPDPAGGSLDEVREIRDMIDERVRELATDRIDAIRCDETAHRRRLAQLLPPLIDEFSENPEVTGA